MHRFRRRERTKEWRCKERKSAVTSGIVVGRVSAQRVTRHCAACSGCSVCAGGCKCPSSWLTACATICSSDCCKSSRRAPRMPIRAFCRAVCSTWAMRSSSRWSILPALVQDALRQACFDGVPVRLYHARRQRWCFLDGSRSGTGATGGASGTSGPSSTSVSRGCPGRTAAGSCFPATKWVGCTFCWR
jgi:hypothetical protein